MKKEKHQNTTVVSSKLRINHWYGHCFSKIRCLVIRLWAWLKTHLSSELQSIFSACKALRDPPKRTLSQFRRNYRDFFLDKLSLYGIKSPAELSKEERSIFFKELNRQWNKRKILRAMVTIRLMPVKKHPIFPIQHRGDAGHQSDNQTNIAIEIGKKRIKSEPNKEQTRKTKIGFSPNNYFTQKEPYLYPVVKMPERNSRLKLPREGRSNQRGYKEREFFNQIKSQIPDIEATDNVHMVIPYSSRPYEPDIVLFDKQRNLYIDIEIDEPYDGYHRCPTHYVNAVDASKQDNIRDRFFTQSGWIVMRFTEKQVHCQADESISLIKNLLSSIDNRNFTPEVGCEIERQWDENQSIEWQKAFYREKYLGIEHFGRQNVCEEVEVDTNTVEGIDKVIQRTKILNFKSRGNGIAFDEESHIYVPPKDKTGNAQYISVTTAIGRFFPFDLNNYTKKKAIKENRTEKDVLKEVLAVGNEAAEKGTFLHAQIEHYLKGEKFDANSKEFDLFVNFYHDEMQSRGLVCSNIEQRIFSNKYNVAGTIDCLLKKPDKDEYVMIDWKRSKKLIIDGCPRIFGSGYALSELSHLDNSSYYKYCLQQNIYKYIVETEFLMKISSMKLVVLHENYSTYHIISVPEMKKETQIILNSLKHKS